ncbi:hypothetical protein U9M48_000739 [Paspalum notatum var. saurae]|uniref:Reverse transcriptase Ty1/copia-type domain-containing protein n=1 Tax=Paspalum notatum var. saurae TaxID=547442 RepID=A0AAQ3PM67_PASNO
MFRGAVISALADKYVDSYITFTMGKELWVALEEKFGVSDAGSELHHGVAALAKELKQFPCELPDKFVAGSIITKLPPSWRDFATSLKHKRQHFSVAKLIGSLDVEEKVRAKDSRGKGIEFSSANMVGGTGALLMGNGSHARVLGVEHFEEPCVQDPEEDDNIVTRKSKRQRTAKSFDDDYIVYLVDDTSRTIEETYSSPDADLWREAVRSEMDSIMSNGIWEVVECPYGCKPIRCKWVFKKKLRPDGTIERYKARLVIMGYSHKEMDVKTAFVNGELDEEIYMDQPEGFVANGQEGMVCKLLKSLYGLKQAPKQWHEKFDKTLTSAGFVVNEVDKCVYYWYGGGQEVILCLYVADILIFGTNLDVIKEVKDFLSNHFEMKDLGETDVILNIKLLREGNGGVTPVQSHYVEKVLSRFGFSDCEPAPTPYDSSVTLTKNRRIARYQLRYSQIIGSFMYLASATRPDISFAVSKLSRFVSNPGDDHWRALERVLCYLKETMSYDIHYTEYPRVLEGYCDANWISDADELYATSGYVFLLGGGAVSWKSCKQTVLTRSTLEAELTALDTASVEAEWLRELLMDLPVVEKPVTAISMNCDNQTAITKVNNSKDNLKSSRHIRRCLKSARKLRNSRVIAVDYIHTFRNLADQFTKGVSHKVKDSASSEMGVRPT